MQIRIYIYIITLYIFNFYINIVVTFIYLLIYKYFSDYIFGPLWWNLKSKGIGEDFFLHPAFQQFTSPPQRTALWVTPSGLAKDCAAFALRYAISVFSSLPPSSSASSVLGKCFSEPHLLCFDLRELDCIRPKLHIVLSQADEASENKCYSSWQHTAGTHTLNAIFSDIWNTEWASPGEVVQIAPNDGTLVRCYG